MAVRLVLAAFVGGVLLMLWGLFYWFVLPIEDFIDRAPAEQRLRVSLRESLPAAGVYLLPYPRDPSAQSEAERGLPQAMIIYRTVTRDPLDATVFALGLLHSILSAGLVAVLLALAGPARLGYWRRYGFVVLAGAAGSYTVEILHLIWFPANPHFYLRMIVFEIGGWLIAGLAMAGLVSGGGKAGGDPTIAGEQGLV